MAISSNIFFASSLVAIAGVVLLLQRRYLPLRTTPEYLLVSTFIPLFISTSIVVLVPIDLASASPPDDRAGHHGNHQLQAPKRQLMKLTTHPQRSSSRSARSSFAGESHTGSASSSHGQSSPSSSPSPTPGTGHPANACSNPSARMRATT